MLVPEHDAEATVAAAGIDLTLLLSGRALVRAASNRRRAAWALLWRPKAGRNRFGRGRGVWWGPAESAAILGATLKRVRVLLAQVSGKRAVKAGGATIGAEGAEMLVLVLG